MASKTSTPIKSKPRGPTRIQVEAIQHNTWAITVPYEVTLKDVKDPHYWKDVASSFQPGDLIKVNAIDTSWRAELMVRAATRTEVSIAVLHEYTFTDAETLSPDNTGFSVMWRGPTAKYSVIRTEDNQTMKSGFLDQSAAHAWLENRAKAEAA